MSRATGNLEKKRTGDPSIGKPWLKRELRPYGKGIFLLALLALLTTALSVAFAYLVRYVVNGAVAGSRSTIIFYSVLLIGLLLARILFQTARGYYTEKLRARMTTDLRRRTFARLLRVDYASLERYHSGDLLNRLTTDVNEVSSDSVTLLPATVGMIVQAVGAVSALLLLDPLFTGIFAGGALLAGGLAGIFRKGLKKTQKEIAKADGESRSFIQESQSSVSTVKAYGGEGRAEAHAHALLDTYYKKRMSRNKLQTAVSGTFAFLGGLGTIFALVWCGMRMLNGEGDAGALLSTMLLLGQLQRPVTAFSAIFPVKYAREASAERLAELDLLPEERSTYECVSEIEEIIFEQVSFSYGRGDTPVLDEVSFSLKSGETVCITGQSGSGKSTLFKLLLSLYQPSAGDLSVRDCNGVKTPLSVAHRAQFAYVPQGNFLFSGTILENLTFFLPEGGREAQIATALKIACAEFAYDLPEGLNTPLLERGGGLSEGQIQRLALARALLSDRKILLLDEATSALDSDTERQVLENLKADGRTCFIVTHRPMALALADRILQVKEGKVLPVEGGK